MGYQFDYPDFWILRIRVFVVEILFLIVGSWNATENWEGQETVLLTFSKKR